MGWGQYTSAFFIIFVVFILAFYWFIPREAIDYTLQNSSSSNFSLSESVSDEFQFYSNMRYSEPSISYRIYDCPVGKKDEMKRSLEIIESQTVLDFYEVLENEEISITCDDSQRSTDSGTFIAGEGGTTNVTKTTNFNVIHNGQVLLLRESQCSDPIVGIHELLHALGFDHSDNPNNIMYPSVTCKQTIGDDLLGYIDKIYSYPSLPDLSFESVSATRSGKYLDSHFVVRNNGLKNSPPSKVVIYSQNKSTKIIDIKPIAVGYGVEITFENYWSQRLTAGELKFVIESDFDELDKSNNEVILIN